MGISVIGNKDKSRIRIQQPAQPIAGFVPVRTVIAAEPVSRIDDTEYESNGADNGEQSDVDGTVEYTSPADIGGNSDAPYGRTKSGRIRNRPVGSSTRTGTARSTSKTTDAIASMLYTIHTVAHSFTKIGMLNISKESASNYAESIVQLTEYYEKDYISQEKMLWFNLAAAMSRAYIFDAKPVVVNGPQRVAPVAEPIKMPDFMTGSRSVQ